MQFNQFKLKAMSLSINIQEEMEILEKRRDKDGYPATYYRIKTKYEDFPIYFRIMIMDTDSEDSVKKQIKEHIKYKREELDKVKKDNLTVAHINYVENQCCNIFGKSYEEVERKAPNYSWSKVKKKLLQIKAKKGNKFKDIYMEFIKTFDINEN